MTLSRTARILIAILLVAAAAFFWVNFFSQSPLVPNLFGNAEPSNNGVTPTVAPSQPAVGTNASPATGDAPATAGGVPATASPTVVVPQSPNVVTRDVRVSDLPFLVTEPPPVADAAAEAAAAAAGATRPQGAQRASVNPFSPILVQAAAAQAPQTPAPSASEGSPEIIISDGGAPAATPVAPVAAPEPVRAPAPRPLAPASSQTAGLPHALPSGTLPVTPSILRSVRTTAVSAAPEDLGRLAAVREPEGAGVAPDSFARAGGETPEPGQPIELQPMGTTPVEAAAQPRSQDNPPLLVGADPLSRYLRDNNVRFTGAVLGPVSVGVFRSAVYAAPVVVSLGQTLPDTTIVLTDLRGHEARFSQDDSTQSLSLDLRR